MTDVKKTSTKHLSEVAYDFICARLASGELKPGGKLSEPSLAAACGVSRTPMREAVRRLIEEGVLYQREKSGTYISKFAANDISEAYEIRSVIESAMLLRAVPNLKERDFTALQHNCDRMHEAVKAMRNAGMTLMTGRPEKIFLTEDLAFHLHLLRASGNSLAEKIIANTYRRNQFFGTHSHQRTLGHVASTWRFHCRILDACRRHDAESAVKWLKEHLVFSEKDALLPLSVLAAKST